MRLRIRYCKKYFQINGKSRIPISFKRHNRLMISNLMSNMMALESHSKFTMKLASGSLWPSSALPGSSENGRITIVS